MAPTVKSMTNPGREAVLKLSARDFILTSTTLILVALMVAVIWAAGASPAIAQTKNQVFEGEVILNGQPAEDDTRVLAYIDGIRVSQRRTKNGRFSMKVWQPLAVAGKTVEFRGASVDRKELRFPQTASWEPGGETVITLELLGDLPTIDAEEQQTHVFQGSVVLDGQPIPDETNLQAYADGIRMRSVRTKGGRYRMEVRQPASFNGRSVEFRGGGVRFPQKSVWTGAGTTIDLEYPSGLEQERAEAEGTSSETGGYSCSLPSGRVNLEIGFMLVLAGLMAFRMRRRRY